MVRDIVQLAFGACAKELPVAAALRPSMIEAELAALDRSLATIAFDMDGVILRANANFLALFGYAEHEVVGRHRKMFAKPEDVARRDFDAFWANLRRGAFQSGEYCRIAKDGREIWIRATYNPVLDASGAPVRIVKYAADVTAEKLRQADDGGQIVAINKSQAVVHFGLDGTVLDANALFLDAMGYRLDEVQGRRHSMFLEPGVAESAEYAAFWETLRAGRHHAAMYKRIGKDGRVVWIQASYNPIFDLNGRPFKIVKFATDVTLNVALAEAYRDAERKAEQDATTSLPNRVRLASFLSDALAQPEARAAVLYLDLDRFKPVNDTFGHPAGDRVLGEVADRMRRCLCENQLLARVGGDEFVAVAPDLASAQIVALCDRLIEAVRAPIQCGSAEVGVGLSIGVAVSPADGETADDLLRHADEALYRAKSGGRGGYAFFAGDANDRAVAQRSFADEIRSALAAEEFHLDYQPRFRTRTLELCAVEALLRWRHPTRGLIDPADFIPLAEETGLIIPLGAWVLRRACATAAAWPGVGISVNVSPTQFQSDDLVATVASVLAETGLEPDRLELEITEGVLLDHAARARVILGGLKALGVRLAMDDFGAGYSSLGYLRSFPFAAIKIDRRFIADLDDGGGGRAIVQAMLSLGSALGLAVTAEGVETAGQLLLLTIDGCSEVQGFFLARPMSAEAVTLKLAESGTWRSEVAQAS